MKRGKKVFLGFLAAACVIVILALPATPTTPGDHAIRGGDWIEEVYAPFDSLATDPDDYLWPTNASVRMSSGFAEYRRTHFHAGIDIGTNGQRGYRVYAARDGHISRVYISPYGYGKMLHVTHADGFVTAYAHLQKFNNTIERFARGVQNAREQYAIDTTLDASVLPVQKGDVIAYTGDTGIGAPHLHFEVRDRSLNPINPLRLSAISKTITDNIAPEFHRVGFIPLDFRSRVNHDFRHWNGSISRKNSNQYRSTRRIHLDGIVGMLIKGSDRVNSSYHRSGIYQLELYLNDSLIYRSRLDQVSAIESRQIALYYDWPSVLGGEGRFQKLFVEKGNRLPLYDRQPEGFGIIDTRVIPEGEHSLRVVASDIRGNKSELHVPIVCSRTPEINATLDDDGLFAGTNAPEDIETITVATRPSSGNQWNSKSHRIANLAFTPKGYRLPLANHADVDVKIVATNGHGISSDPIFVISRLSKGAGSSLVLEKEIIRNYLFVRLSTQSPFTRPPAVFVTESGRRHDIEVRSASDQIVIGTFPLSLLSGDTLNIHAEAEMGGSSASVSDQMTLFRVPPADERTIVHDDSALIVSFLPEAVYDTLYLEIRKDDEGYSLNPQDVLLKRGVRVRHSVPENVRTERTGLFMRDDGERRLIGKWRANDAGFIAGESTRLLGDIWIMQDTIPPALSALRLSATRSQIRFSFRISDDRAGVDPNGFRITAGEKLFIAEYDPYKRLVHFEGDHVLAAGKHQLLIRASDRLGNTTELKRSFSIPR